MQTDALDRIIRDALEVMESSKYQIYEIAESVRRERDLLHSELQRLLDETTEIIEKVDQTEIAFRRSRMRLTEVSRDFQRYGERDIRAAYEEATQIQLQLLLYREKEANLKQRRNELQQRIKLADRQVERAETLVSQLNVAMEYLSGDLNQVTRILESAKTRQMLGLKIVLAQEEERKRIAREIHDGPAQSMANVVLRSEIAERLLAAEDYSAVQQELAALKGQVRGGLEEVRQIIFNLRPMTLDDLGLVPTVRKFVQHLEEKTKIRTQFQLRGKERRLPSGMEVAIYRLIQEACSNAIKHAEATHIMLEIAFTDKQVKVLIKDNGKGFDVDLVQSQLKKGSETRYGLIGMRERVEMLEGRLDIRSAMGEGTRIEAVIPTNPQKEDC